MRSGGRQLIRITSHQVDPKLHITRPGSHPSKPGPAAWFTGTIRIDPHFTAPAPARVAGATVTFEPGARTAWYTHPLGPTLLRFSGFGLAQREDGPIEENRPRDIVWFAPGQKHWHGASPATAMTHLTIEVGEDGRTVDWLEQASDEDAVDDFLQALNDMPAPEKLLPVAVQIRGKKGWTAKLREGFHLAKSK